MVLTTGAMLIPLGLAFQQIQMSPAAPPARRVWTGIFVIARQATGRVRSWRFHSWSGGGRRLLGWLFPKHRSGA